MRKWLLVWNHKARERSAMLLTLLLLLQSPPAPPPPACRTAEHRQLDFWVGDWDVFLPNGRKAGRNTITREYDGCVVQEHWTGAGGVQGSSFNIWDAATKRWHQTWVDTGGTLLLLDGGLQDGVMVMEGESAGVHHVLRLEPQKDGKVHQLWRTTSDGGQTWTVVFDGTYVAR